MKIVVPTENGYLADKYSKYAAPSEKTENRPKISFPVTVSDLPTGTKTWALTLVDFDAVPVSGFVWIHWLAANIPANITHLPENASLSDAVPMVQGSNSTAGGLIGQPDFTQSHRYIGPTPPDKDHEYTLTVYALDTELNLKDGFWLNEFRRAIKGHILAKAKINLWGRS